jgi:hypothetical protein
MASLATGLKAEFFAFSVPRLIFTPDTGRA